MNWAVHEIKQQPYFLTQPPPQPPPPPPPPSSRFNLNNIVSPSILLIIVILAIMFFISGLLHLLVRFLLRPPNRVPDEIDNVTALQGQLQQLFNLHDAGVDQSFIDSLPLFIYKEIIGVNDPFDCAVCLCEFEGEDKLRLLPKCSHAFHMDCIDTWLLSHSTCPLCRANLVHDFARNSNRSPIVLVLESGRESVRENVSEREIGLGRTSSVSRVNSHLSCENFRLSSYLEKEKSDEIQEKKNENREKVVSVKLGKFRSVDGGDGEGSSESNANARRCFSMGSFAYVMDENSSLQVPIRRPMKKQSSKKPLKPGHRVAMSECGYNSMRDFNGFEALKILGIQSDHGNDNKSIGRSKKESFSVSKIWLRGRKDESNGSLASTRRAFSFRFPLQQSDESKPSGGGVTRAISEIDMGSFGNGGSDIGFDEITYSCNSIDSQENTPSFARRTLLWLIRRENRVDHSSFSSNV